MLLQRPKLRTEVHEIAEEARFQLNRRTFCRLELSRNGLLTLCPATHHRSTQPKLLLGRGRGGRGLLLITSLSASRKPIESSLSLRFQAITRHTLFLPIIPTWHIRWVGFPPRVAIRLC